MQPEQELADGGRNAIYRVPEGALTPSGLGVGQKRILILSSILFFPHRTTNMTSNVMINLRWRRCPGNRATRPIFSKESRDRTGQTSTVSFFGTLQAALGIHLRSRLPRERPNKPRKDESIVTKRCFS
jgi:hypothetical protein